MVVRQPHKKNNCRYICGLDAFGGEGPDESAKAEFGALIVDGAETVEERRYAVVVDHSHNGGSEAGPCVGAIVRLTG